jgi:hypothetical protein
MSTPAAKGQWPQDEIDRDPASISYTVAQAADVLGWTADDVREADARGALNPFDADRQGRAAG